MILCAASIIQQYGIIHTTVGKSGFITTMYIILVPFLGLFVKLRVKLMNWVCAIIALTGCIYSARAARGFRRECRRLADASVRSFSRAIFSLSTARAMT